MEQRNKQTDEPKKKKKKKVQECFIAQCFESSTTEQTKATIHQCSTQKHTQKLSKQEGRKMKSLNGD